MRLKSIVLHHSILFALSVVFPAMLCAQRTHIEEASDAINHIMRTHLYDKTIVASSEYREIEQRTAALSHSCTDLDSFIRGYNDAWSGGPFSHVRLNKSRMTADATAEYLDTMNVPVSSTVLTWNDDIAVLTVHTMMGRNTITQITDAYRTITERKARALIIDLRKNEGGAFAVRPLVGHVIPSALESGVFLSRSWTDRHSEIPGKDILGKIPAWDGWSIRTFWKDVQENGLLRIVFAPIQPLYDGPVFVLVGKRTASAAELAADALFASGRAILIGETTAGKMLSQKMYDIPHSLQLSLPIADYISVHSGRIEGRGITPAVPIPASKAMDEALERAQALPKR